MVAVQVDHGTTTLVVPWYHVLVKLDRSPEVDEHLSKSGSMINNHLFTYASFLRSYRQLLSVFEISTFDSDIQNHGRCANPKT